MAKITVEVTEDIEPCIDAIKQLYVELDLYASRDVVESILAYFNNPGDHALIKAKSRPASSGGARQIVFAFQPGDCLLELISTLRTLKGDFDVSDVDRIFHKTEPLFKEMSNEPD